MTQLLDVRLGGGIADDGIAFGGHAGHNGVFGGRDRRFIQQDIGAGQPIWRGSGMSGRIPPARPACAAPAGGYPRGAAR